MTDVKIVEGELMIEVKMETLDDMLDGCPLRGGLNSCNMLKGINTCPVSDDMFLTVPKNCPLLEADVVIKKCAIL